VIETLRDYCRLFISPEYADDLAQGFIMQEQNWEGPLAVNDQVDRTLLQWQILENKVGAKINSNYRFQMGLMRAYYDAYIKQRLVYETHLEYKAKDCLRQAKTIGSLEAIKNAQNTLNKALLQPVATGLKQKCEVLSDSLYKNIGCQLSVEKHGAKSRTRGAFMDGIDEPLNNIAWLTSQFSEINKMESEDEKLSAIDRLLNRTNPGPGGFYDNMGTHGSKRRIKNTISWEEDPGTLDSPRFSFNYTIDDPDEKNFPLAWKNQVTTIYETPLVLFYEHLDPLASYSLKVAYVGRITGTLRLVADEKYTVHDLLQTGEAQIREFRIPRAATEDGYLELKWTCGEGQRGTQVAEIWLIKN